MNASMTLHGAIARVLDARDDVWVVVEGDGPVVDALTDRSRVLALPVADRAAVAVAVGMAWSGAKVVVELAGSGRLAAVLEVLAEAGHARVDLPGTVVVRVPWGHETGVLDAPWLELAAHTPGLRVLCPRDVAAAARLLDQALGRRGVVLLAEPRGLSPTHEPARESRMSRADAERWSGEHGIVAAWGPQVSLALDVAEALEADGLSIEVIDLVSLAPLDRALIGERVREVGRLAILVPETALDAGDAAVARRVAEVVVEEAFFHLETPIAILSPPDVASATVAVRAALEL